MSKKTNIFLIFMIVATSIIAIVPGVLAEDLPELHPHDWTLDVYQDIWGNWKAKCQIHNGGTAGAGTFCDKFFIRPAGNGSLEPWECVGTSWHLVLASGATSWDYSDSIEVEEAGNYTVKFVVDYTDLVTESNENNNECSDVFYIGT